MMYEKPKTFEDAKALVKGNLGVEFEKYPLKLATAAYFGPRPQVGKPIEVNSGSASLLRLKGQPFALTCSHVLSGFRERLTEGPTIFQIGNCELDPIAQLKAEDRKLDFALIELTKEQATELISGDGPFGQKFSVEPSQWPPGDVKEGNFVAFGGFPGELRRALSLNEISFGSYSSGASKVTAVNSDYFVCQFEREVWIKHGFEPEPKTIRGMSGGPVLAIRRSAETDIATYEFVGHIYEFSESFELLYVRLARVLPI